MSNIRCICNNKNYAPNCINKLCDICCIDRFCENHRNTKKKHLRNKCSCHINSWSRLCENRLCNFCCNNKECYVHKNRCPLCRLRDIDDKCCYGICRKCCKFDLCYYHNTITDCLIDDYKTSFTNILSKMNVYFPNDLLDMLFTKYIDVRKECKICICKKDNLTKVIQCSKCNKYVCLSQPKCFAGYFVKYKTLCSICYQEVYTIEDVK